MSAPKAYEDSLREWPNYPDGSKRKSWEELGDLEKSTWVKGTKE